MAHRLRRDTGWRSLETERVLECAGRWPDRRTQAGSSAGERFDARWPVLVQKSSLCPLLVWKLTVSPGIGEHVTDLVCSVKAIK